MDTAPPPEHRRLSALLVRVGPPILIAAYILLAVGFTTIPTFEGIDEIEHYRMIHYIAENGRLPDPTERDWSEYFQPPLYYALGAVVSSVIDDSDFAEFDASRNIYHGYLLLEPGNDNKNTLLHRRSEAFPYTGSGTAAAVHLLRLLSVLMGAGTLVTSYAIFREVWPEESIKPLLAMGLLAFWPQFLYLSGNVTNDNLVILLSTIAFLLLIRQVRQGPSLRNAVLLGVVIGLAVLTKVHALALLVPLGAASLLDRRGWRFLPVSLGVLALIAGWWFIRNWVSYGSPLGVVDMVVISGWAVNPDGSANWQHGLQHMPGAYQNFWARFGHYTLSVGEPIYWYFNALTAAAAAGLILRLIQRLRNQWDVNITSWKVELTVAVFLTAWLLVLLYAASVATIGTQARYTFPAIAAWAMLLALGLTAWMPRQAAPALTAGILSLSATVAAASLLIYYLPVYRPQAVPAEKQHLLAYTFEDAAELTGVEPEVVHAVPGEIVRISLYWRAIQPTETDLLAYLHTTDSDVIRRDSYPATGNLRSLDWTPGEEWGETYVVTIPDDAEPQRVYPLIAGLFDPGTQRALPATANGQEVVPYVGQLVVHGAVTQAEPVYRFGEVIGLLEPEITPSDEGAEVCLTWVSLQQVAENYHVFIHVVDEAGALIQQVDGEPRQGRYPTSVWWPGEQIRDCTRFSDLPDQGWSLRIGLYSLDTGARLEVTTRDGAALPDGIVPVGLP